MHVFGADPVGGESVTHGSLGTVDSEWSRDLTVVPSHSPEWKALALGADVDVGGSIIDEAVLEVSFPDASVVARGHDE